MSTGSSLEDQIELWRDYLRRNPTVSTFDVVELEDKLRAQIAALKEVGLAGDEAFLVAVKRLGNLDAISRKFAREHSERLWKQLMVAPEGEEQTATSRREPVFVIVLALLSALAFKLPELFGLRLGSPTPTTTAFYLRNASLFVYPFLVAYFIWKRRSGRTIVPIILCFAAAAVFANVYPIAKPYHTLALTGIHLPIALWMAVGLAYVSGLWGRHSRRMDFIRFSGELFIYYSLIALGGGALSGFTVMMFQTIGLRADTLVAEWIIPCGALGAVIIGSWLVEAKQNVIENMAPVLTRIFTPLFTAVLLTFLATMAVQRTGINIQRNLLIGFDLLLVVVVGLVLYTVSARNPETPPGLFDVLQLLLVLSALFVDGVALASIARRISSYGFSANKVAALGENVVLLGNLMGSAWLSWRFLRGRTRFSALERWQTAYLPVYFAWAWFVVIAFPPLFGFR